MVEESPAPLFVCADCRSIFVCEQVLDNHMERGVCTKYDESEDSSFDSGDVIIQKDSEHEDVKSIALCSQSESENNSKSYTVIRGMLNKQNTQVHTKKKSHRCEKCGKVFQWRTSFEYHQRTHTGQKPYPCSFCEKSFSTASHRKRHERTHTGEKPHQCTMCEKAFIIKQHLDDHVRAHTGARVFQCDQCDKSFTYRSQRAQHMEKVHLR